METTKLSNGTEVVVAEYREQVIPDYRGNPFIEVLPDVLSPKQVIANLAHYPSFNPQERLLEPHLRIHMLQRLFQYFQPFNDHLKLYNAISIMIRNGYMNRNPFSPNYVRRISQSGDLTMDSSQGQFNYQSSTSKSLTLIGISGSGKSSSIEKLLSLYPQVVVHSKYKGKDFSRYPVIYFRIEAPFDGSLKALCLQFFSTIDILLGTEYMTKYGNGRHSSNVMIQIISKILQNIGLGFLCIDEVQHLSLNKSGGAGAVLNFFTMLINIACIPIFLVGTPKALSVLQSEFRQARRGISGHGNFYWDRLKKDQTWELFLAGLWKYQWIQRPVELNDELLAIFHEEIGRAHV